MDYFVIDPAMIDPVGERPTTIRVISEIVDLETIDIQLHEIDPGTELPPGYHSHDRQESVLFVIWGTLHVETPSETYEIEPGNLFIVKPGKPFRAFNPTSAERFVEVLRISAPTTDDLREYHPDKNE